MSKERDIEMSLEFTWDELQALTRLAKEAGLTPQEYVRKKLIESFNETKDLTPDEQAHAKVALRADRKDLEIRVRLSPREKAAFVGAAKKAGRNLSNWLCWLAGRAAGLIEDE